MCAFATCWSRRCGRCSCWAWCWPCFQQWCGINVIFNYAEEIFRAAGYDISSVLKNIAWTGSVNLVFTFVALGVVDRGGRRPLMLFGAAGLAVIYTSMGFCYHGGVTGIAHAAAGAGGHRLLRDVAGAGDLGGDFGDLPQPHSRRGDVHGGGGAVDGVLHSDLHISDAECEARCGRHVLALRRVCVLGFIFIWLKLPETKGRTLEQIESDLAAQATPTAKMPSSGLT